MWIESLSEGGWLFVWTTNPLPCIRCSLVTANGGQRRSATACSASSRGRSRPVPLFFFSAERTATQTNRTCAAPPLITAPTSRSPPPPATTSAGNRSYGRGTPAIHPLHGISSGGRQVPAGSGGGLGSRREEVGN